MDVYSNCLKVQLFGHSMFIWLAFSQIWSPSRGKFTFYDWHMMTKDGSSTSNILFVIC